MFELSARMVRIHCESTDIEGKSDLSDKSSVNCQLFPFKVRIICEYVLSVYPEFELSESPTYPREILVSDFWARVLLK